MRLALIARSRGDIAGANAALSLVILTKDMPNRSAIVSALILKGQLLEAAGDSSGAREQYKAALREPGFAKDPYAMLSVANVDFAEIFTLRPTDDGVSEAREAALRRAFDEYKEVLKSHPSNVYAANGLGSVLAEQGRLEHAREVFTLVREASSQECASYFARLPFANC